MIEGEPELPSPHQHSSPDIVVMVTFIFHMLTQPLEVSSFTRYLVAFPFFWLCLMLVFHQMTLGEVSVSQTSVQRHSRIRVLLELWCTPVILIVWCVVVQIAVLSLFSSS